MNIVNPDHPTMDEQVQQIVDQFREQHPEMKLFQIIIPDREDEIFLARKCSWNEYKRLIGSIKNEADANEVLVQKFLVHPTVGYEQIQTEWDPGLVVTLAQQIQKGLGFASGASIKKF